MTLARLPHVIESRSPGQCHSAPGLVEVEAGTGHSSPRPYESSLTGILNAPWKTNSDRQSLLEGPYNREIIEAGAGLVAERLAELHNSEDHGAHLDLLPARLVDAVGWAERALTEQVFQRAAELPILPDSDGVLRRTRPAQARSCRGQRFRPRPLEATRMAPGRVGARTALLT